MPFLEQGTAPSSRPQILNTLTPPPLQKETIALKDKLPSTPLENAETVLDEEVSMVALSYAMALQEKENEK